MIKRIFDIVAAAAGIVLMAPMFVVVSALIKIDSTGPVFFRQQRVGKNFKLFTLYKFRSMIADAQKNSLLITAKKDRRITRVGRVLRAAKIDELPQLINVLLGDMSIVGPRPEVPKYVELFRDRYREVLSVRPGLTDYASIQYRDEESVLAQFENPEAGYVETVLPEKIRLATNYIREQNMWIDIQVIIKTVQAIVTQIWRSR